MASLSESMRIVRKYLEQSRSQYDRYTETGKFCCEECQAKYSEPTLQEMEAIGELLVACENEF